MALSLSLGSLDTDYTALGSSSSSVSNNISYSLPLEFEKAQGHPWSRPWIYAYLFALILSSLLSFISAKHMRGLDGNNARSTVRFVVESFLFSTCLQSIMRFLIYLIWIIEAIGLVENGSSTVPDQTTAFMTLIHSKHHAYSIMTIWLMLHHTFRTLMLYWMILLIIEIYKLAVATYDRGEESELAMIRKYTIGAIIVVVLSFLVGSTFTITYRGYHQALDALTMVQVTCIVFVTLFAICTLTVISCKGRKMEHVHGMLKTNPLYRRLKIMTTVACIYLIPYCITQIARVVSPKFFPRNRPHWTDDFLGLITFWYFLFGAAVSVIMAGSQEAMYTFLYKYIPEHIRRSPEFREWQMMLKLPYSIGGSSRQCFRDNRYVSVGGDFSPVDQTQVFDTLVRPMYEPATPPEFPVFVTTDIESSSALWAQAPGHVMDTAQEIHDNILRSTLLVYNGYEITTQGDAFQLAFHTIADAAEYCLDVQMQLLNAKWPKELEGIVEHTKTVRGRRRAKLFRGLRVRMGIHDTEMSCNDNGRESMLVSHVHPVTGKTVYIGSADQICKEIGDIGFGGQIIVTKRVAQWLHDHKDKQYTIPYLIHDYGEHEVASLQTNMTLYELIPRVLSARCSYFEYRRIERKKTLKSSAIHPASPEDSTQSDFNMNKDGDTNAPYYSLQD